MQLLKSKKFQQEYQSFKSRIDSITDVRVKKNLEDLLSQLVSEVKELDNQHSKLIQQSQLPSGMDNARTKLFDIRKKIDKILNDWKSVEKSRLKQNL